MNLLQARLYIGQFLGQSSIVKQRFSKKYRHPELDTQLTKDRHRAEVRAILRCKTIGVRTPILYLADNDTTTIVMENMDNAVTAKDYINNNIKEKKTKDLENVCNIIGSYLNMFSITQRLHSLLSVVQVVAVI